MPRTQLIQNPSQTLENIFSNRSLILGEAGKKGLTSEQMRVAMLRNELCRRTGPFIHLATLRKFKGSTDLKNLVCKRIYNKEYDWNTSVCSRCKICFRLDEMVMETQLLLSKDEEFLLGNATRVGLVKVLDLQRDMVFQHVMKECEDILTPLFL